MFVIVCFSLPLPLDPKSVPASNKRHNSHSDHQNLWSEAVARCCMAIVGRFILTSCMHRWTFMVVVVVLLQAEVVAESRLQL